MDNLSDTTYFQLLTSFLQAIGQAEALDTIDQEEGIIEWSVGNLLVRLVPHVLVDHAIEEIKEPDALIIEVDLMFVNLENKEVNYDRFLILHQLNNVSLITTGIVASITEEGMLSIDNIIPLNQLDQESLANQIGNMIKAAEELYDVWNELADMSPKEKLSTTDGDGQEKNLGNITAVQNKFKLDKRC